MTETAFTEAFRKAGHLAFENEVMLAVALYFNRGGTRERLYEMINSACKEMRKEGSLDCAGSSGPSLPANLPQPSSSEAQQFFSEGTPSRELAPLQEKGSEEGRSMFAGKAGSAVPDSLPPQTPEQSGHPSIAPQSANKLLPSAQVSPKPESVSQGHEAFAASSGPSSGAKQRTSVTHTRAKRGATEIAAAQSAQALTVFESFKISDGRSIGMVWSTEYESLEAKARKGKKRNAMEESLFQQLKNHGNSPHRMRTSDWVSSETLQRMIRAAAEVANAL